MINQDILIIFIEIIIKTYENALGRIITDVEGEYFRIKNWVKQGYPLSALLFNNLIYF